MKIFRNIILCLVVVGSFTPFTIYGEVDFDLINVIKNNEIRIIVIRHGEALHNVTDVLTSSTSPGIYLTKRGVEQVQNSANKLALEKINKIYVSPVFRTLQTAQLIGIACNIPHTKIAVEDRLREQFFGEFENRSYEEYVAYFSNPENALNGVVPGGEPSSKVFNRTHELLWQIAADHSQETVLLVTHSFNCSLISQCLEESYIEEQEQAEFRIYEF